MPVLFMSGEEDAVSSIIPRNRIEGVKNRGVRTKGCSLLFLNTRCRIHCGTVVRVITMATEMGNRKSRKGLGPGGLRMI